MTGHEGDQNLLGEGFAGFKRVGLMECSELMQVRVRQQPVKVKPLFLSNRTGLGRSGMLFYAACSSAAGEVASRAS